MPPDAQVIVMLLLPVVAGVMYIYRWEGVRQAVGWQGRMWPWVDTLLAVAALVDVIMKHYGSKASTGAQADSTFKDKHK